MKVFLGLAWSSYKKCDNSLGWVGQGLKIMQKEIIQKYTHVDWI